MRQNTVYFEAASYGEIVHQAFVVEQNAEVYSRTSKGLFIKGESKWLVFLSRESHRNPLTINLPQHLEIQRRCDKHDKVFIQPGHLFFQKQNISISILNPYRMWVVPKIHTNPTKDHLLSILSNLKNNYGQVGKNLNRDTYIGLLGNLIGDKKDGNLPVSEKQILRDIQCLINSFKNDDEPLKWLSKFLGRGKGLTPSGDDYIIGFLLILNRYGKGLVDNLDEINHEIVEIAYQKTNTLSANLIECASSGKADERLISFSQLLITKTLLEKNDFNELATYGSSSGFDSFIGMVSGIQALLQ